MMICGRVILDCDERSSSVYNIRTSEIFDMQTLLKTKILVGSISLV